jgi:hypothetical protein
MSQEAYLDQKAMGPYGINRSTVYDLPIASFPRKGESDGNGDASPWASFVESKESVYVAKVVPAQDEYPDGGLRAWLVVLGVRPSLQICV